MVKQFTLTSKYLGGFRDAPEAYEHSYVSVLNSKKTSFASATERIFIKSILHQLKERH